MEHFAPVLGMTMMVVGLIGSMAGISLLIYFIWQAEKEEPAEQTDTAPAADVSSGVPQS